MTSESGSPLVLSTRPRTFRRCPGSPACHKCTVDGPLAPAPSVSVAALATAGPNTNASKKPIDAMRRCCRWYMVALSRFVVGPGYLLRAFGAVAVSVSHIILSRAHQSESEKLVCAVAKKFNQAVRSTQIGAAFGSGLMPMSKGHSPPFVRVRFHRSELCDAVQQIFHPSEYAQFRGVSERWKKNGEPPSFLSQQNEPDYSHRSGHVPCKTHGPFRPAPSS